MTTSSLFLLDRILDVESLRCIQINKDVGNATIADLDLDVLVSLSAFCRRRTCRASERAR
jgi:hypothetical protein